MYLLLFIILSYILDLTILDAKANLTEILKKKPNHFGAHCTLLLYDNKL